MNEDVVWCFACTSRAYLKDGCYYCPRCGFLFEDFPFYDRVHYFEDEDIFPNSDFDDDFDGDELDDMDLDDEGD